MTPRLWALENEDEILVVIADTRKQALYEALSVTGNTFRRVEQLATGEGVVLHKRRKS